MKTVFINRFDAGIANDPRADGQVCRVCTNFDALTNPFKLTPYHDSESGDSAAATSKKQNFAIALRTGSTYSLYSLGVVSGLSTAEVLYRDVTSLTDGTWTATANNQAAGGATSFSLFTYYKKTGLIYGASGGNLIWTYDPTGVAAFSSASHALSYTNIAEGIVHSKDNFLYIPYDNKIASNNNGSWTDTALTLPDHLYITSICEHGGFLAIAAAPLNGLGGSRVYLWDMDSLLTNMPEIIDWGEGILKLIQELNGDLIGISVYGNNTTRFKDRVVFKRYTGAGAQTFLTLEGGTATQLTQARQRIDNRLFFMMSIVLNGTLREGVWSVGKLPSGEYSLIHEYTPNNDTALTSGNLRGFFKIGDYIFQSYQSNGTFALSKTNDQASYTATSIYESKINPAMPTNEAFLPKKFGAVAIFTEPLSSGQQVVVKRKVDGGSYVTVLTKTSTSPNTDLVGYDTTVDASGNITDGREIEFRIESTGGAVITGLAYRYEVKPSNIFPK